MVRYIILMPAYAGSCIRDEYNGEIDLMDLDLPKEFYKKLTAWHEAYREIIPLDEEERKMKNDQIEKLDNQGLILAKELINLISGGVKIKYFSEGRLKYLEVL